jgi:hypothetical protein
MRKWKLTRYLLVALLTSFAGTGCGMLTTPPPEAADSSYCMTAKPIYIGRTDVISDETARAILEHNVTGAKNCGWGKLKEQKK